MSEHTVVSYFGDKFANTCIKRRICCRLANMHLMKLLSAFCAHQISDNFWHLVPHTSIPTSQISTGDSLVVEVSYPACPGPRDKVPGAFFKYLLKCFNKYQLRYSKRYLLKYSYNTESHFRFDFIGSQGFQVVGAPFILVRTVIITISFTTVIINIMIFIIPIIITIIIIILIILVKLKRWGTRCSWRCRRCVLLQDFQHEVT